jgi:hypothetical protein
MSKDIVIQTDGVDVQWPGTDEIITSETGGGSVTWVPEDETTLGTITITANGSYDAEDAGVYGFSTVIVNVPAMPESVTGHGQDGNDYTVTVDDTTGLIVETKIPSSIQITTEPTKLTYEDGETIVYTGIVVKAYDGNGNLFDTTEYPDGVIPFSELQFPVTKAVYPDRTGDGAIQTIPVNWPRPGDGKLLSATFEINVGPGEEESETSEDDGFTGNEGNF